MSKFDHRLPLHVGDYLADTMHLNTLQHGIYIRWIMHYWKRRELPDDEKALAQIAGLTVRRLRQNGDRVRALFCAKKGTLTHKRLDAEIARAKEVSEARSSAGKQGAIARWSDQDEVANAKNSDGECHSPAGPRADTLLPSPSTLEKDPPRSAPVNGGGADADLPHNAVRPPSNSRDHGTNPRALGTNPRALATNPRAFHNGFAASWYADQEHDHD